MINRDRESEGIYEIRYPEKPNLDYENAKKFYIVGNEYDNDDVRIFIDRPSYDVDEGGKRYWVTKLADKMEYYGVRVPRCIANAIGLPDFDSSFSLVKVEENPENFFKKKGYSIIEGHLAVLN